MLKTTVPFLHAFAEHTSPESIQLFGCGLSIVEELAGDRWWSFVSALTKAVVALMIEIHDRNSPAQHWLPRGAVARLRAGDERRGVAGRQLHASLHQGVCD